MLSNPENGWCDVKICNWSDRCCYLNDVPFKLLNAVLSVLRTKMSCSVEFDTAEHKYVAQFEPNTVILASASGNLYKRYKVSIKDIAVDLVSDIRKNVEAWAKWDCDELDEKLYKERMGDLYSYCSRISRLVDMV